MTDEPTRDPGRKRSSFEPARPWPKLKSEHGPHMVLFRPRYDTLKNPRTDQAFQRLVLETPDWVNVVALTRARQLVLVHQYRFGTSTTTLEIPGGVIDRGESHADAARRELQEETGYTAPTWRYLGAVHPNPAFLDNLCHHWLAEDAELTHPQDQDSGEDIQIVTLDLDEVRALIAEGEIRHSLVITALSHVLDLRR